jgi:pilus assembly protein CpaB
LELKPEQSETLARARQSGTLSLALRSLVDANEPALQADEGRSRRDTVNIVRFGVSTPTTTQK